MLQIGIPTEQAWLLLLVVESGFVIGGVGLYFASRNVAKGERRARRLKFIGYFFIIHGMLLGIVSGRRVFTPLLVLLLLAGCGELFSASRHQPKITLSTVLAFCIYPAVSMGVIFFSLRGLLRFNLYLFVTVAVLDAYSQIVGQLFGRYPLAPSISPGKTIEGALGGTAAAIIAALICRNLTGFSGTSAVLFGCIVSCIGISADLAASKYKRICSIKDYSRLLPGQGGVIDRFNSFFAAATVMELVTIVF